MTFFITGATGHLGYHLINQLQKKAHPIVALVLPNDPQQKQLPASVFQVKGNLLDPQSIDAFLSTSLPKPHILIHAASKVTTQHRPDPLTYRINVGGTKLLIEKAKVYHLDHMIYVSSVHALKEIPLPHLITEADLAYPSGVKGFYAQTKAEASQSVWHAFLNDQLPVSIVYPSGFIGPHDPGQGYTSMMIREAMHQRMNIWFHGGYDFVDVRDVAAAIITIAEKNLIGKTYVLNANYIPFKTLMRSVDQACHRHPIRLYIPRFLIWMAIPLLTTIYWVFRKKPLLTSYALYTMQSNTHFSHERAFKDFGYQPRTLQATMNDTVNDLKMKEKQLKDQARKFRSQMKRL